MLEQYLETDRYLSLMTPAGENAILLLGFSGQEALSRLFRFELDLMTTLDQRISFDELIGKPVSFGVTAGDDDGAKRHFNGICVEFSEGDRNAEFQCYKMVVAPK